METLSHEETVKEVKTQWERLWWERIDDKMRAEGIAIKDYTMLFIEKGTVIFATRDFKHLNLKDILDLHGIDNTQKFLQPHPSVGGWGKFIRTAITSQKPSRRTKRARQYCYTVEKQRQQLKKGGRGWLHT